MKILQISPQLPYPPDDGGRIGIYNITKYVSALGHKIDFLTYSQPKRIESGVENMRRFCNPIVVDFDSSNSKAGMLLNIFSAVPYNISKYKTINMEKRLEEYLKSNAPDVVHVDHLHMGWVINVIRKYSNVPVVLREHNVEMTIMQRFSESEKNLFIKKYASLQYRKFLQYEPAMCRKFDVCIPITDIDEERLQSFGYSLNCQVVSAGVSSVLLQRTVPKTYLPFSIYHIGSLEWLPNIQGLNWFLNEVFPELIRNFPKIVFFIYGRGAEKILVNASIKAHVVVKGFVDDLWTEIHDKQVAVIPLQTGGGMRIKILELMACGKSIVSTSVGKEGIPFENNIHGKVADTKEEFVRAVSNIFENPEQSFQFSYSSRKLIAEKFSWEAIAKQFEAVYKRLLK